MTIPSARPTEYKGIVYRSKSEAMFARWLELSRCGQGNWEPPSIGNEYCTDAWGFIYEPKGYSIEGWTPDFLTWRTVSFSPNLGTGMQLPMLLYGLIEYKPSLPTSTYIEEFRRRCETLMRAQNFPEELRYRGSFYLYHGSIYSASGVIELIATPSDHLEPIDMKDNWIVGYEQDIKSTRFDLEAR